MTIIRRIARKEMLEMLRDGRFRLAGAVVLLLFGSALAMGWLQHRDVSAQHETARRLTRDHWLSQESKNPHSAAHYGIYAFKPKTAPSLIDDGVDRYTGVATWLEAHRQNEFRFRPAGDATGLERFGALTAAAVLQILVPLLIILLGFAAFAGEREQGTLRQLLSLGVAPRRLAAGKAIGVSGALLALLLPAAVAGAYALAAASGGTPWPSLARLGLMAGAYLLYFAVWVGLTLGVSAAATTARGALAFLLGIWVFNSVLAPRLVTDAVRRVHPTPSTFAFTEAIQRDYRDGLDGHNPADRRSKELEARVLAAHGVDSVSQLPVSFAGIALQEGEEYGNRVFDKHYEQLWRAIKRQERLRELGGALAPLLAVRSVSMGLAGTDIAHHLRFAQAAEAYRRDLVKEMNDDLTRHGAGEDFDYQAGGATWAQVPEFGYGLPSARWALANHQLSIALLALWATLAAAGAWLAVRRVRPDTR